MEAENFEGSQWRRSIREGVIAKWNEHEQTYQVPDWDQQEDEMLRRRLTRPRRYMLRYLFYRRISRPLGWSYDLPGYNYPLRCEHCKQGQGKTTGILWPGAGAIYNCTKCGKRFVGEHNTNRDRRLFLLWSPVIDFFWWLLQVLHIVKSNTFGRYDFFGDEERYVAFRLNLETGKAEIIHLPRRWWEYIIIPRP